MTSFEIYERFVSLQKGKSLKRREIAEKYGINFHTLDRNILSLKWGKAGPFVRNRIIELLEKLEKEEPAPARNCIICGKPFRLNNLTSMGQRCCSPECSYKHKIQLTRDFRENNPGHDVYYVTCQICGKVFEGEYRRKFCSKECRRVAIRKLYREKAKMKEFFEAHKQSMDRVNDVLNSLEGGLY